MIKAFFIDGCKGKLFCLYYIASTPTSDKAIILYPPFAEEMNKSRRMIAMQARAFAGHGINTLIVDLYGTGDSEGQLEHASLDIWYKDMARAIEWVREAGNTNLSIWGIRLGGLIALNHIHMLESFEPDHILLWQPVAKGENHINQLLRLRLAAGLVSDSQKQTIRDLKAILLNEKSIEIAGYRVSSELVDGISALTLPACAPRGNPKITWVDTNLTRDGGLTPATAKEITRLKESGVNIDVLLFRFPSFWNTQEITEDKQLIDMTIAKMVHA